MKNFTLLLLILFIQVGFAQSDTPYSGNYTEPYRPQFHFTPQTGWMNDPNGLVFYNGTYHLFYQYYPNDIIWGPMHWGHAASTDLLHWKPLPIALYPDHLGWIFSGSAVIDTNNTAGFGNNAMIAIYTYHNDEIWKAGKKNTESQGIAYSLDEGKTWTKYAGNPVLNNSGQQDFRDPKVFWNDTLQKWSMALAVGDTIVLFSSPNLKTWSFESNFKPIESKDFGVWECPDLFKLNAGSVEKWIMIVNHGDKAPNGGSGTRYFVGNFDGKQFIETQPAKWLDHGTDFYAGVTYANAPDNKRILMGWMSNWQYATKTPTKVWRSAMALPRELALVKQDSDFVLRQKMIPGLTSLMQQQYSNATEKLPFAKTNIPLSQSHITFEVPKAMNDFNIILSNTKDESFVISYSTKQLTTDRSKSGKTNFSDTFSKLQQMVVDEAIYKVELIVDKSSIEILLNDGIYVMTNKVFPNEDFSSISITSDSGKSIANLKMSRMASVWKK